MSEKAGRPVTFTDLSASDLSGRGLDGDTAARRLHVVRDGRVIAGFPAFLALWSELPRLRWLARVLGLPGLRTLAGVAYDRGAAPLLYALHRRRQARTLHKADRAG